MPNFKVLVAMVTAPGVRHTYKHRNIHTYLSKLVSEVSAADGRISSQTGRILGKKTRKKSAIGQIIVTVYFKYGCI